MKKVAILLFSFVLLPGFVSAKTSAPLEITTTKLHDATIGEAYSTKVKVKGGTAPYSWLTLSTTYPSGCCVLGLNGNGDPVDSRFITFDTQTSETLTDTYPAGTYDWTFQVTDAVGNVTVQTISLTIKPAK
jgi:hypothetical protein